ncbi:hypothetical protein DM02DRAFT_617851 [Periconia macrospinosa]|uniref:Uncharacterized protein n=1 Tax=Periconia macrospinosa TaxID=97972 RepID=A0A2V1DBY6_9PLEO|nr:hypothetical protein DM02DRAFT_617851 [Periconia macrospinosa]
MHISHSIIGVATALLSITNGLPHVDRRQFTLTFDDGDIPPQQTAVVTSPPRAPNKRQITLTFDDGDIPPQQTAPPAPPKAPEFTKRQITLTFDNGDIPPQQILLRSRHPQLSLLRLRMGLKLLGAAESYIDLFMTKFWMEKHWDGCILPCVMTSLMVTM